MIRYEASDTSNKAGNIRDRENPVIPSMPAFMATAGVLAI
jgi:hypothetical protein